MAKIFTRGEINDLGPITSFTTKTNKCVTYGELINLNAPANIVINSAGVGVETTKTVQDDGSNEKVFDYTTIPAYVTVSVPKTLNSTDSLYCTVELIEFNGTYTFPVSIGDPSRNNYASKKLTNLMASNDVHLNVGGQSPSYPRTHALNLTGWIPYRSYISASTREIYKTPTSSVLTTVSCNCTGKLRFTFTNLPDLDSTKLEVVIGATVINGNGNTEYEYIYTIGNSQQMLNFYDGGININVNYYDVS